MTQQEILLALLRQLDSCNVALLHHHRIGCTVPRARAVRTLTAGGTSAVFSKGIRLPHNADSVTDILGCSSAGDFTKHTIHRTQLLPQSRIGFFKSLCLLPPKAPPRVLVVRRCSGVDALLPSVSVYSRV
jgi:hypothetical protein